MLKIRWLVMLYVLKGWRDKRRSSSRNSHSNSHGSHDYHARGRYQKLEDGVDYDSDASHKSSHHGRTPKTESSPRPKTKLDQYKCDHEYIKNNVKGKQKCVCYMERVPWTKKKGQKPQDVLLYFYKIAPRDPFGHASDWEMSKKFKTLKKLKHESLMRCYEWFQWNSILVVSYEYVAGESLLDRLRTSSSQPFNEMALQAVMTQILSAVDFMHRRSIVHNGLWLKNFVIYNDTKVKIVEWDYAMQIKQGNDTSLHYLSFKDMCINERPFCSFPREALEVTLPEAKQVEHQDSKKKAREEDLRKGFGRPVDMWALGVCFYTVITGRPPYVEDFLKLTDFDDFDYRRRKYLEWYNNPPTKFANEDWERVSILAKDICYEMLRRGPRERLTIQEALKHPWTVAKELKPVGGGEMPNLAEKFRPNSN
ncbi:kinase-like protein [Fomitiporia mediterranea MF3/22]|uniref:kinase-like protein n=1 Tax=Fomitiporia mediterranea (strain MF3/22) TaxID=694068 RepID=UPI0004409229|nr:kinase-like protein [Fomitiporia mediterranea MF3/22]EJD00392.1 kinase-like protein [Fomitiporia mediterranea MF3/22]